MKIRMLVFAVILFSLIPSFAGAQTAAGVQQDPDVVTNQQLKDALRATQRKTDKKIDQSAAVTQKALEQQANKTQGNLKNLEIEQKTSNATTDAKIQNLDHRVNSTYRLLIIALSVVGLVLLGTFTLWVRKDRSVKVWGTTQMGPDVISRILGTDPEPYEIERVVEAYGKAEFVLLLPDQNLFFACVASKDPETKATVVSFLTQTGERRPVGLEKRRKAAARFYASHEITPIGKPSNQFVQ